MNGTNEINTLLTNARSAWQRNNFSQAYKIYNQILVLTPNNTSVIVELGRLCAAMGYHEEANNAFQRAIKNEPNNATNHYMLGALNLMAGNYLLAIDNLKQTLHLDSKFIAAFMDLGTAYFHLKQYDNAVERYDTYLKHRPNKLNAIYNLGLVKQEQGKYKDAESLFRSALSQKANSAEIHNSLGHTLNRLDNLPEAEKHCRAAIRFDPSLANAHYNLGGVLFAMFKFCDAEASYIQALRLNPQFALAENSLANTLLIQGEVERAEKHYRKAITINNESIAHSNLLLCMHYHFNNSRDEIFNEHKSWSKQHASITAIQHNSKDENPEKTLHVGYVSANYCQHSVAFFLESLFRCNNQEQIKIYCYSDTNRHDNYTDLFQKSAAQWRQVTSISNTDLADQIKRDKIDILVDLAGHTDKGHYRLGLFALKPAPIQATYLGYPDTTGVSAIDYRLTDSVADPAENEQWHSETLAYLDTGFLCYTPPHDAPAISQLPATTNNFVTFGSFNNLAKISPETLNAWIEILQRVPNSRLLIKTKAFFDSKMIHRYKALLSESKIDESRIEILGWTVSTDDHLSLYNKVDIGLDTFPYNGTTTTCEALWMSVPVVTLKGEMHCSRVGASLLTSAGLTQYITSNVNEYIEKAIQLANDTQDLCKVRASLREHVANSYLHNSKHFTQQLEICYRDMWRRWCDNNN